MAMSGTTIAAVPIRSRSNVLFTPTGLPFRCHDNRTYDAKKVSLKMSSRLDPSPCSRSSRGLVFPDDVNPKVEAVKEEARAVVAKILLEQGVSEEEAVEIASKSPNYAKMLAEGVRELDEASLWDSWNIGKGDAVECLSFKEKVLFMAKNKRDGGIIPFLESIGLDTSASLHIARYLSSETVPSLIHKVKFLKEMLYPNTDKATVIGKRAYRMMTNLSISVDDDIQQVISYFTKMEARRGGVNVLDSADDSFSFLVQSFPRLLLLSTENDLSPLVDFFEANGVPRMEVRNILLIYPPIFFSNIEEDLKPRLQNFMKIAVEKEDVGRALIKYPWILSASIQRNYNEILSYFEEIKVPKEHVDHAIISWPYLLGSSTNKVKSMVAHFGKLGVRTKKLGQIISSSPQLLLQKPHVFHKVVSFMEELGFEEEGIGRILVRCPEIFAADVEKTLKKKVQQLLEFGIYEGQLSRVIRKYPELLVSDVNGSLLPRMRYLMKVGLSRKDVVSMVSRFSPLLGYSVEEVLKPKLEFLVYDMHKTVKDVVAYPRYFSYSLEKKIKPRFCVLKGRNVECSLKEMLGKNDEDFAADYMGIERAYVHPISTMN